MKKEDEDKSVKEMRDILDARVKKMHAKYDELEEEIRKIRR